jgi:hypothetical protein
MVKFRKRELFDKFRGTESKFPRVPVPRYNFFLGKWQPYAQPIPNNVNTSQMYTDLKKELTNLEPTVCYNLKSLGTC